MGFKYNHGLGRKEEFDERSREYPIRLLLRPEQVSTIVSKTWPCSLQLDQGQTSACTGFSATYDLAASPSPLKKPNGDPFDYDYAQTVYHLAQKNDEWPGEDYDGSSVLGAAKALTKLGYVGAYHWAFGIDDVYAALSHLGPVVVGTSWLEDMFSPSSNGLIRVSGESAGGHAYMLRGITVSKDAKRRILGKGVMLRDVPLLRIHNSWGPSWGVKGEGFVWGDDMAKLLADQGEARITTLAFRR